jgi:hypothetical protein
VLIDEGSVSIDGPVEGVFVRPNAPGSSRSLSPHEPKPQPGP